MNQRDCEHLNYLINNIPQLQEGFELANFFIQPQVFHLTKPIVENQLDEHSHNTFEITMILEGNFTYLLKNIEFTLGTGDLVIIPPKLMHRWRFHDNSTTTLNFMCSISVKGLHPKRQMAALLESIQQNKFHIRKFSHFEQCLRNILDILPQTVALGNEEIRNFQENSYIYLFRSLLPNLQPPKYKSEFPKTYRDDERLVEQMKHYIYDNLFRSIRLDEFGRMFGMSKEHLNRVFKKQEGITIGQFVTRHKIERALKMLSSSNKDIKTVAIDAGFSDLNYFCFAFKKHIGESPSSYRKRMQKC